MYVSGVERQLNIPTNNVQLNLQPLPMYDIRFSKILFHDDVHSIQHCLSLLAASMHTSVSLLVNNSQMLRWEDLFNSVNHNPAGEGFQPSPHASNRAIFACRSWPTGHCDITIFCIDLFIGP